MHFPKTGEENSEENNHSKLSEKKKNEVPKMKQSSQMSTPMTRRSTPNNSGKVKFRSNRIGSVDFENEMKLCSALNLNSILRMSNPNTPRGGIGERFSLNRRQSVENCGNKKQNEESEEKDLLGKIQSFKIKHIKARP